jgi:TPR repeat protein
MRQLADAYQGADFGLPQNDRMAASKRDAAAKLQALEKRLKQGEAEALAQVGRELLGGAGATEANRAEGLELLERAAAQGDAQLQYAVGAIFLFGRHGQMIDQPRGRSWWDKALAQHHVKTMEYVAPAYQSGRFGYPVDLLKSQALVEKLVTAYAEGRYGVDPDSQRERYWRNELDHFERLFELSGGGYLPPGELRGRAEAGDATAQYQYGRQLLVSGPQKQRQQGLMWIERSAENGFAEAQYRLVTYYERQVGIMRSDPARGVALLTAAAQQNHLPAIATLALGYFKGRHGLKRDLAASKRWYEKLLQVYERGDYLGEIDERFIPFQQRQLEVVARALASEEARAERYRQASPLEREVIEIGERWHREYERAVNRLKGSARTREAILALRDEYHRRRDAEMAELKRTWTQK